MLHFSASTSAKHTIESWEDTNQNQSEMFRSGRYDVSNGSAPLPLGRRRKPNNLQYGCIDTESTFLRHVAVQFPNSWILLYKRTVSCNYTAVSENSNNFPNIGCQTQSQAALSVENAVNDTTRSGFQKVRKERVLQPRCSNKYRHLPIMSVTTLNEENVPIFFL